MNYGVCTGGTEGLGERAMMFSIIPLNPKSGCLAIFHEHRYVGYM